MADNETVAAAAETAVRDERDLLAQTASHDRACRREHLAHSRPAARTFGANDDDVAGDDCAVQNPLQRFFLRLEHARPAAEARAFFAADFRHCSLGREVAVEDDEMPGRFDRIVQWPDDRLARGIRRGVAHVFRERLACDRQAIAV